MNNRRTLTLSIAVFGLLVAAREASFSQFMINVQGPSPSLTIATGTVSAPNPVVNTSSRLRYRRWLIPTKVTVSSVCAGQSFNLRVVATGATIGIAAPEVSLTSGMPEADFITGILPGFLTQGVATLRYTASATFQQGNSTDFANDVHTVTYTIVAQ